MTLKYLKNDKMYILNANITYKYPVNVSSRYELQQPK